MKPFQKAYRNPLQVEEMRAQLRRQFPNQIADDLIEESLKSDLVMNDKYQVSIFYDYNEALGVNMVHLSIRRLDNKPIFDWRDMQEIKNQLVGKECEGVQLFPAESRLVDTSNQYHIWCIFHPGKRFPFGFDERMVSGESAVIDNIKHSGHRQRSRK